MFLKLIDIRIGRANRLQYLILFVLFGMPASLFELLRMDETPGIGVLIFISLYLSYVALSRRFRDMGYTGWFAVLGVVFFIAGKMISPVFGVLGTLVFIALFVIPGDKERNEYGAPPVKLNFLSMVSDTTPANGLGAQHSDEVRNKIVEERNKSKE
jgi:uncharacterized membrane protein YhaH (DUF805 family)